MPLSFSVHSPSFLRPFFVGGVLREERDAAGPAEEALPTGQQDVGGAAARQEAQIREPRCRQPQQTRQSARRIRQSEVRTDQITSMLESSQRRGHNIFDEVSWLMLTFFSMRLILHGSDLR